LDVFPTPKLNHFDVSPQGEPMTTAILGEDGGFTAELAAGTYQAVVRHEGMDDLYCTFALR
jgi:hypothetical protein